MEALYGVRKVFLLEIVRYKSEMVKKHFFAASTDYRYIQGLYFYICKLVTKLFYQEASSLRNWIFPIARHIFPIARHIFLVSHTKFPISMNIFLGVVFQFYIYLFMVNQNG
ncbi:hypothetical protein D1970_07255 [Mesobacillus zeae]|uniref:Uncharacterized protein n=1 Tax=Mesobacillus zeae TaxID=1917180 RepID=A0A398B8L3_9BACI|nr:hypothetical protein D1970_07255 [Mesobacillus zeae]